MGLDDTHFRNATGAPDDPRHVTSAVDLAALGRAALRHPVARTMVGHAEADVTWPPDHTYHAVSGNWIVRDYAWADGVKSGYTGAAKYCIVASGTPGLRALVSVTMHEPTRIRNIADSLALLRYGSALFHRAGDRPPRRRGRAPYAEGRLGARRRGRKRPRTRGGPPRRPGDPHDQPHAAVPDALRRPAPRSGR